MITWCANHRSAVGLPIRLLTSVRFSREEPQYVHGGDRDLRQSERHRLLHEAHEGQANPVLVDDGDGNERRSRTDRRQVSAEIGTEDDRVLFQNSAERESVRLLGFGPPAPSHSRSTWRVLDPA